MAPRIRTLCIYVAVVAAAFTLLVSVLPFARYAYESPQMHVALETTAALAAALASFLVLGRYRREPTLGTLLLAAALGVLAANSMFFSVIPSVGDDSPSSFPTWSRAFGGMLGAFGLAAAALAPDVRIRRPRRAALRVAAACVAALGLVALGVAIAGDGLPEAIDRTLSPDASGRPRIVGEPAALAVQLLSMCAFSAAAVGFARRAESTGDDFTAWLAVASTVGAFARLNYFLFPSLFSDWIYTGDALRLVFFALLVVGAAREIGAYQRQLAEMAVFEERRRMARDLHDGLAQELAFITTRSRHLAARAGAGPGIEQVASAAERALEESRAAISSLTRPLDEPLDQVVARAAEDVAGRAGVDVSFELDEVEASPQTREAFARIVRESVTNAVRHGGASELTVRLRASSGIRLEVCDNGRGFDPAEAEDGPGFGLVSMRERARAIGGELSIHSSNGSGTTVEVLVP